MPIIVLTGRSEKSEILTGYAVQCDEYLVKPLDPDILFARLEMLLNRAAWGLEVQVQALGAGAISAVSRAVLVPMEARLLAVLAERPGVVVERSALLERLFGDRDVNDNALDALMMRLRRKLHGDVQILTVRGEGFMLQLGTAVRTLARADAEGSRERARNT